MNQSWRLGPGGPTAGHPLVHGQVVSPPRRRERRDPCPSRVTKMRSCGAWTSSHADLRSCRLPEDVPLVAELSVTPLRQSYGQAADGRVGRVAEALGGKTMPRHGVAVGAGHPASGIPRIRATSARTKAQCDASPSCSSQCVRRSQHPRRESAALGGRRVCSSARTAMEQSSGSAEESREFGIWVALG
jgi:hypothetical protein